MIDYRTYRFTPREILLNAALSVLLCLVLAFAFYGKWYAALPLLPVVTPYFFKIRREARRKERQKILTEDFSDLLAALAFSCRAGRAAQTAFPDALRMLRETVDPSHPLLSEWERVSLSVRNGLPPGKALAEFAERTGIEEIENFAAVFPISEEMGGDQAALIEQTLLQLAERTETEDEIETAFAAKKLEHTIMSLMPCGILYYMRLTSPDLLHVLHHTVPGLLLMTGCLAVYAAAFLLGRTITDITV